MRVQFFIALIALGLFSTPGSGQYFNKDYSFGINSDEIYGSEATLQSTIAVSETEIVSVGYIQEDNPRGFNDIVVMKLVIATGDVIWSRRIHRENVDERALSVTLGYDEERVIIVGKAQRRNDLGNWDAFVMKFNHEVPSINWVTTIGAEVLSEEFTLVEKTFPAPLSFLGDDYFLVGTYKHNRWHDHVLFAASVSDDGTVNWSNYYALDDVNPKLNDRPYGMAQNPYTRMFTVAGTSYEDERPSNIFTIQLNPQNGGIVAPYKLYDVEDRNEYGGGICNLNFNGGNDLALVYTTDNPRVRFGVNSAITVLRLNGNRDVLSAHYYWQPGQAENKGLSIHQGLIEDLSYDVFTNTTSHSGSGNPGFMNVNQTGGANLYSLLYNFPSANTKEALHMFPMGSDYIAKSLVKNNRYTGLSLKRIRMDGGTNCAVESEMSHTGCEPTTRVIPFLAFQHGSVDEIEFEVEPLPGEMVGCGGSPSSSFKNDEEAATNADAALNFDLYPNPLVEDHGALMIRHNVQEEITVELEVYNALGQQVYVGQEVLNAGGDQFSIDADQLSKGMNWVVLKSGDQILSESKVMKQ